MSNDGIIREVYVEIFERSSGDVVRVMGPMTDRQGYRVIDGAFINMNTKDHSVRIVYEPTSAGKD